MPNGVEGKGHGVIFVDPVRPHSESASGSKRNFSMQNGNCATVPADTMFPSNPAEVQAAKRICADCPIKEPCLEYALYNKIEHGYIGGTSERERKRIARRRRQERAAATR